MKTVLKIIGIIVLIIIVLIAGFLFLASKAPSAPKNYAKEVEAGGEIESRYMQEGAYSIKRFTAEADDTLQKHLICYPAKLESGDKKYPVIFSLNGTYDRHGFRREYHLHTLRHLYVTTLLRGGVDKQTVAALLLKALQDAERNAIIGPTNRRL